MPIKKYLFACGCPRSGTTALWRLLSSHSSIAIGVERYVKKAIFNFSIEKKHFGEDRFFDYQDGDTHYPDLTSGAPGNYYTELKGRYNDCIFYGDKIPKLYPHFDKLIQEFEDITIYFIYRNVFDVVQSYKKRFLDSNDRWNVKIDDGILDWNKSLEYASKFVGSGKVVLINYESLFYDIDSAESIFSYIGLPYTDDAKRKFGNLKKVAIQNDERRESILTSVDKKRILKYANFSLYNELLKSEANLLKETYNNLIDSTEAARISNTK